MTTKMTDTKVAPAVEQGLEALSVRRGDIATHHLTEGSQLSRSVDFPALIGRAGSDGVTHYGPEKMNLLNATPGEHAKGGVVDERNGTTFAYNSGKVNGRQLLTHPSEPVEQDRTPYVGHDISRAQVLYCGGKVQAETAFPMHWKN